MADEKHIVKDLRERHGEDGAKVLIDLTTLLGLAICDAIEREHPDLYRAFNATPTRGRHHPRTRFSNGSARPLQSWGLSGRR